jgi:hypothetical protein
MQNIQEGHDDRGVCDKMEGIEALLITYRRIGVVGDKKL